MITSDVERWAYILSVPTELYYDPDWWKEFWTMTDDLSVYIGELNADPTQTRYPERYAFGGVIAGGTIATIVQPLHGNPSFYALPPAGKSLPAPQHDALVAFIQAQAQPAVEAQPSRRSRSAEVTE